jgi:hypothetical protein
MNIPKGKLLDLQARLQNLPSQDQADRKVILRGNELYRLLSILNKVKWKRKLLAADEHDMQEIEDIEQGRRAMLEPGKRFFPPAFTRYDQDGILCWFQDLDQGSIRPLTEEELAIWKRVGPTDLQGYIRLDHSIQAYLLSGSDEQFVPEKYGHEGEPE